MLSGRGLCVGLITRPEESYRLLCVVVCVLESSKIGGHNLRGATAPEKRNLAEGDARHIWLEHLNIKTWQESVYVTSSWNFDVLLTVHLSIFISLFNPLDAQNLFHNKFYFMPLHVSSTCAHHQEFNIALHSLWYRLTYRWLSLAQVESGDFSQPVRLCNDTTGCVMQFWPPDDELMCSKHVEALNKFIVK